MPTNAWLRRMHRVLVVAALAVGGIFPPGQGALAATHPVTNCNDAGPGSLRDAVARAGSGDVVDMRALACRVIRTTSALRVPQYSLTLVGPGISRLTIDMNWTDSVVRHTGTGLLRLQGLTLMHGIRGTQRALGGCVYTAGSVELEGVELRSCAAHGLGPAPTAGLGGALYAARNARLRHTGIFSANASGKLARGGGLYVVGDLSLYRVRIDGGNAARGGGVYVLGALSVRTSTFASNLAGRDGGAIHANGPVSLTDSTLMGNSANGAGGAFWMAGGAQKRIVNSTISGNRGARWSAGFSEGPTVVANSTLAFNATWPFPISTNTADCTGALAGTALHLESTIVARSRCVLDFEPRPWWDVEVRPGWAAVSGHDNLVMSANASLPSDTLSVDPRLAGLGSNGGYTLTHALRDDSPALDSGNNAADLDYDQRGTGFPRVKGTGVDIGAFER